LVVERRYSPKPYAWGSRLALASPTRAWAAPTSDSDCLRRGCNFKAISVACCKVSSEFGVIGGSAAAVAAYARRLRASAARPTEMPLLSEGDGEGPRRGIKHLRRHARAPRSSRAGANLSWRVRTPRKIGIENRLLMMVSSAARALSRPGPMIECFARRDFHQACARPRPRPAKGFACSLPSRGRPTPRLFRRWFRR
jgi:hypothetical protein